MTHQRIYNFNAGPSQLPLPVLEEIQSEFLNFNASGMSVTEISHRSVHFDAVIQDAVTRAKRLLNLDETWQVLFIQGGASMQFAMIPMNFLGAGEFADIVDTGIWSSKAIKEAKIQGKDFRVVASSADKDFSYIPKDIQLTSGAKFIHLTSNNTIKGTQYHTFPDTSGVPVVCDMSSDIFSRPLPTEKFGMIYAGAQKNLGPSGCCMVLVKKSFLERANDDLPSMLSYKTYADNNSMYNTPPCFGIYTIGLVLKWLEEEMGGLEQIEAYNIQKAGILYDFIDDSKLFSGTAEMASRSLMNVTFRLPDDALEKEFIQRAQDHGLGGLKGHRSVGGCRASIYNAATMESVYALVEFMESFEREKI